MAVGIRTAAIAAALGLAACGERAPACPECASVRIVAVREPATLLPPLVQETVGRDISDRIFQRLANLKPNGSTIDVSAFAPDLATAWERVDSLTWRFTLDPAARWHDGPRVTASDVVFSFNAWQDTTLATAAASALEGVKAVAQDSTTVTITFPRAYPEQLYDATWHVRILPRHIWAASPPSRWADDTSIAQLVGSGPYRMKAWVRGQSVTLVADTTRARVPAIRQLHWRFAADPDGALTQLLGHEADLIEHLGSPAAVERAQGDTALRLYRYPSAVYGFAAYRIGRGKASVFADRRVRQALTVAADREAIAKSIFGPGTVVPSGPVSRLQWIGGDGIASLPFDSARAATLLSEAGWTLGRDGIRRKGPVPLAFSILVPSTSGSRRLVAQALQAAWQGVGARPEIELVDFPVFQQRLSEGKFDVYVGAYLDEPSPRGLVDQWTRAGWEALNYGHYANPTVDSLVTLALGTPEFSMAKARWREALDSLNADAPAVFLYAPEQTAAASSRIGGVAVNPWSWLEGVEHWTVGQVIAIPFGRENGLQRLAAPPDSGLSRRPA